MDERLEYEQLMAGKLESLPVPDIQDLIWARVKAQLDIDLPTDEGNGGSSPQKPSGPGIIGWGLSIVIVALIITFFVFKNKSQIKNTSNPSTTTEQTIQPTEQSKSPPGSTTVTKQKTNTVKPGQVNAAPNAVQDSAAQQNISTIAPNTYDSETPNLPEPTLTVAPPRTDTTQPVKKGKGVRGLTDDDYRIVPKKDN